MVVEEIKGSEKLYVKNVEAMVSVYMRNAQLDGQLLAQEAKASCAPPLHPLSTTSTPP